MPLPSAFPLHQGSTRCPDASMAVILFFKILSTSDISVTFAFYNGLTKGSEVRFMRKILLVDDNSAIAQELAKLLKRRGYGVQIAATVAGAKEVIEKEPPLFISSDLDLPDGSGLELLDMVRAADADLPFLIASCHASSHYEAEAVRRGVTLCLDKTRINFVADKLIEYAYFTFREYLAYASAAYKTKLPVSVLLRRLFHPGDSADSGKTGKYN